LKKPKLLKISGLVSQPMARVLQEKKGGNLGKNLCKLLKTHIEKKSENRLLAMLMKPNELRQLSGDVDEKKGERGNHEIMNFARLWHCRKFFNDPMTRWADDPMNR
jgi:hypothetical protein